ncbi:MAG: hypothetical protein E6J20_00495 [Chloroflexi bacterium]|nr:MAG: hypothetical protein E6J20_00495 [Chloroflexota bacterium]
MTPTLIHKNRANGTYIVLGDPGDFAAYPHSADVPSGDLGVAWADPINGGSASSQWEISPKLATILAFRTDGEP